MPAGEVVGLGAWELARRFDERRCKSPGAYHFLDLAILILHVVRVFWVWDITLPKSGWLPMKVRDAAAHFDLPT